ncbi:hypothetical protein LRS10_22910 [Phenylobacterium sp. J426]|nr:hypothetical protein [Phenylobacterium sp. J426]MCR5876754.1 hypothetical protein [Phenylobacterium sp. J426]
MPEDPRPQLDKFKDLAHELEADEDEARCKETVRRVAPKEPPATPDGS